MIQSFKSKLAEDIYDGVSSRYSRKLPAKLHKIAVRKLDQLNAAAEIDDLNQPPSNRLEKIQGNLSAFWSIRVNKQYRIIFRWKDGDTYDVDIIDYHK